MKDPPNVQPFIDKLNELLLKEEKVLNETAVNPFRRMPDRRLLKTYVASCEYSTEAGTALSSEGFMQADELVARGYNVKDLDDLKKRLEK